MSQSNPYDAFVMDHIKNARNYGELAGATHKAEGLNPLCGDELNIYLKIAQGRIADAAFHCACCGISMASASVMTETVKTMEVGAARSLAAAFVAALHGNVAAAPETSGAQRAILASVKTMPGRDKCAALPWLTLEAALEGRAQAVSAGG